MSTIMGIRWAHARRTVVGLAELATKALTAYSKALVLPSALGRRLSHSLRLSSNLTNASVSALCIPLLHWLATESRSGSRVAPSSSVGNR